jgi:predicted RNase H-like nuclease
MILVGVDGCRGGWVVARATDRLKTLHFSIVTRIEPVLREDAIVAIDIPIGLPAGGPRRCDVEARRFLGPRRGSRVFPAPTRAALAGCCYRECSELNHRASGRRLSKQTYAIIGKIGEVDRAVSPDVQHRIREVHPEASFRALKGAPLQHSKKTAAGSQERLAILASEGLAFDPFEERVRLGRSRLMADDLLDAAACLVTARRILTRRAMVLGDGSLDARNLRMEIVA